jgi:hypothetical protein
MSVAPRRMRMVPVAVPAPTVAYVQLKPRDETGAIAAAALPVGVI